MKSSQARSEQKLAPSKNREPSTQYELTHVAGTAAIPDCKLALVNIHMNKQQYLRNAIDTWQLMTDKSGWSLIHLQKSATLPMFCCINHATSSTIAALAIGILQIERVTHDAGAARTCPSRSLKQESHTTLKTTESEKEIVKNTALETFAYGILMCALHIDIA